MSGYPTVWLTSSGKVLVQGEAGQTAVSHAVRMKLEAHEAKKGLRPRRGLDVGVQRR